ncbi:MAG: class I mannose-6-phosphate isomerase [Phycisphaerae bacterium]|nr:class I mannose-6-phosphate isomerase [Phycisphaerae bacterium]
MTTPVCPVVCTSLFKPKPWGGRTLERLFAKELPPDTPIGESWELVSLPDNESRVREGPCAGRTLSDLVRDWGADLLGCAPLVDEHFPLLIKFLDARENLSVQVHPKPAANDPEGWASGIKHEAWFVMAAEPGAEMFVGLKDGVTPADVERATNTPAFADLLRRHPVAVGQCYYLPSGTVHALGAGIVVAEVQTPSDITYRFFDWGRTGLDGKPRALHLEQAAANTRYDVRPDEIRQPVRNVAGSFTTMTRCMTCRRFTIDRATIATGERHSLSAGEMLVWVLLAGKVRLSWAANEQHFGPGDVVLIPAAQAATGIDIQSGGELLEIRIAPR